MRLSVADLLPESDRADCISVVGHAGLMRILPVLLPEGVA